MTLGQLKKLEESKRDAAYDPKTRWLHIQQTISWAEANLPRHLQRNRPRTRPDCLPPKVATSHSQGGEGQSASVA